MSSKQIADRAQRRHALAEKVLIEQSRMPPQSGQPFIVYQLVDPRDNRAFYIGSGKRGRPYEHFSIAANGASGRKNDRVRELLMAGELPKVEILLECDSREWAYENEAALIASTPGLLNDRGASDSVNFLDEFVACMQMTAKHKTSRYLRLLRMFPLAQCAKHGFEGLWLEAFNHCLDQGYGKTQNRRQTEQSNHPTTH